MTQKLSVVVPMYNESPVIAEFCRRLYAVLPTLGMDWEVIVVDDGSADDTWAQIEQLSGEYANLKGLRLSRNFGHQRALVAGLSAASGDAVVMMDGDLQHPPEVIPRLLERWRDGFAVVNTVRVHTEGVGWGKKLSSRLFYAFINRVSDVRITPGAADFRLIDRAVLAALNRMKEHTMFLRGLMQWVGFSQTAIEFDAEKRFAGQSKYSTWRMLKFALTAVISFSTTPLRLGVWSGLSLFCLSWLYGLWAVYAKFIAHFAVPGWASVLWLVMFASSIQLFVLGVMAEYLAQIYEEAKDRPLFLVRENLGFPPAPDQQSAPFDL
jgi:polyisoprenyl-phosphate glycosyltransferase